MPRTHQALVRLAVASTLTVLGFVSRSDAVAPGLRLYADEIPTRPLEWLRLGTDASAVPLSSLTLEGHADASALEAGTTWTFVSRGGSESVMQVAPADPAWSCNVPSSCSGTFGPPATNFLLAGDTQGSPATRNLLALGWSDPGTLVMRGQIDAEGTPDETRVCAGGLELPWLVFPNADGARRYLAAGDPAWTSVPLPCIDGVTQGGVCGGAGTTLYIAAGNGTTGTFGGRVASAGTLTLPSGHVLDGFLIEQLASAEGYLGGPGGCSLPVARLRLYDLLWIVPGAGIVAEAVSPDDTPSLSAFTSADAVTLAYGLLPPVALRVDTVGPDSISVSWDPGSLGANPPDAWTVHWGTAPGAVTAPPFSATALGTSFTVSGLTVGTEYWISVSATKSYSDPVSGATTTYESVALPASIGADVDGDGTRDFSYPPEVSAIPGSGPARPNLLRDDTIASVLTRPDLAAHFPLDPAAPYVTGLSSGDDDPDPLVVGDGMRPFVLYAIDPSRTIRLVKAADRVRVDYR